MNSYGSPGDVEYKDCALPETIAKWTEAAKKALSEGGGFTEVTPKPTGGQLESKAIAVNVNQVEWVAAL